MNCRMTEPNRYQVTSQSSPDVEYTVILNPVRHSCSCPHFVHRLSAQQRGNCKHISAVLADPQAAWTVAAEKATTLTDTELETLLVKYQEKENLIVAGAIRFERHQRREMDREQEALKALFA